MSLTGVVAKERAEALGKYPSPSSMPAPLVYQLALTRAEAGEFNDALALFKGRFFPSEEGGVNAAQVLFEIRLMQAEAEAASGRCSDAEQFLAGDHAGLAVNGAVAQADVRMAAIAKTCKHPQEATQMLQQAAASKTGADAAWADKAEKLLGTQDAAKDSTKLQTALTSAERVKDTSSYTGWWWYNIGTMRAALNRKDDARQAFEKALLLPDSMMSHHMARAALAEMGGGK